MIQPIRRKKFYTDHISPYSIRKCKDYFILTTFERKEMKLEALRNRIVTTEEVCEAFQINKKTLLKWRKEYGFPQPIVGNKNHLRYDQGQIEEWLENQKNRGEAKK